MNTQQAENLRVLIRHMETDVNRTLEMNRYGTCGTPACALGEACVAPGLANIGLPKNFDDLHFGVHGRYFAATSDDVRRLFGIHTENAWRRSSVTPQEWAIEARKVLAEHCYTMDAPADPFKRFMDKVREPVQFCPVSPGEWA